MAHCEMSVVLMQLSKCLVRAKERIEEAALVLLFCDAIGWSTALY